MLQETMLLCWQHFLVMLSYTLLVLFVCFKKHTENYLNSFSEHELHVLKNLILMQKFKQCGFLLSTFF